MLDKYYDCEHVNTRSLTVAAQEHRKKLTKMISSVLFLYRKIPGLEAFRNL